MVDLPEPIVEGDLERTALAHVLAHVAVRQITGSLVLWPAEGEQRTGQDRIRLESGMIVAARLVDRGPVLDRALVPLLGRPAGPYAVYENVDLVGDSGLAQRVDPFTLLASGSRSVSRDDAVERLLEQLGDRRLRLRAATELKRFGLLPKEERFVEVMRAGPATVPELLRACELGPELGKRLVYLFVVTKQLEPYEATAKTSLPVDGRANLPTTGSVPPIGRMSQPPSSTSSPGVTSSGSFASSSGGSITSPGMLAPPERISHAPDARQSHPGDARTSLPAARPAPSATSSRFKDLPPLPPEPPSSGLSPDQLAFWQEVVERCRVIETQTYFQMLNVPRDSGTDVVRREYFALAKRWHPDRVTGSLAPIKPFVERVFSLFTQAHDTLSDEKKRGPYLRTVQDGGGTPEADRKLGAIVAAAMEHQKAEVLIRRRDFEGAKTILEAAIDLNPEEADALASLAWTLFQLPNEKTSRMIELVDRAIRVAPRHDRAHYTRGMIQRRIGNEAEAIVSFRAAADANPKNLDAVREVRLADMRSGQGGGAKRSGSSARPDVAESKGEAPAEGGFLAKLFGAPKKK